MLTAHKLRLYLKQHKLQVSGEKATLVARVLRYVRAAQQILESEANDATSGSRLQSSGSEDDAQSDSSEMGDFIEHGCELFFFPDTSWCRMRYSTKLEKDSGIFTTFVGGGWAGGGVDSS